MIKENKNRIYLLLLSSFMATLFMMGNVISMYDCIAFQLFVLLGFIGSDFLATRRISLFQIWNFGFLYVIWAEMMTISVLPSASKYLNAISFLLIANMVFVLGYTYYTPKNEQEELTEFWLLKKKKTFFVVLVSMTTIYLTSNYVAVLNTLISGRQLSDVLGKSINIGGFFYSAFGLMVPALAAYYIRWHTKMDLWWSAVFLLPVVGFQMALGTRFRLVYMILPWLILTGIVGIKRQKWYTFILAIISAVIISEASDFIKDTRTQSLRDVLKGSVYLPKEYKKNDIFVRLADKMSAEGCVKMTFLAEDWFSTHNYEYGKETGVIFYWMIPRALWKDKPTPVDHWLIRKYEKVADQYSSASGFTGEIRADFGYWCLIIVFFFGWIVKRLDNYVVKVCKNDRPTMDKIVAALLYPCVFFFVRSPFTALQSFFWEFLIYLILRKWLGTKCEVRRIEA